MSMIMKKESLRVDQSQRSGDGKVVCVAVRASKEIPKSGLLWALTHLVHPGDCIKLLLLIPSLNLSQRKWGFSRFIRDCGISPRSFSGNSLELKSDMLDSCSKMVFQLRDVYNPEKVKIRIKIIPGSPYGSVASEAKRIRATWVILDKRLKCEKKICVEELQCNIVVMRDSEPKFLRLNFRSPPNMELERSFSSSSQEPEFMQGLAVTPASSPEGSLPLTRTDVGTTSISSSSDPEASPFFSSSSRQSRKTRRENLLSQNTSLIRTYREILEDLSKINGEPYRLDLNLSRSVRDAISLSNESLLGPPPLCSTCQHKAPAFGTPPRWFTFEELERATKGFSQTNFLAEGGFGSVHRGVLPDGQVVAVKQLKPASSQGDTEFCSEVEVLSCAQHRNVVMLIGICVEGGRRLLVYEYVCNGSLNSHLYGRDQDPLEWPARKKIAIGAARGLRYLHEECRVGCIVHRDMRPNNILLTHDFEPLVGDFGLARWQPDGAKEVETRVIGTFGYLAPEYAQSGQITEKADVYSFGVVLVELVTGRKAMDIKRPKGQQCLTEWARPLLQNRSIGELVDPLLKSCDSDREVRDFLQCASLCIRRDPHSRPRMSQVLRILEGDMKCE